MDFFIVILYGVIQGLSEFLPVSSSGHLALLPFLMSFKDPGVLFDLCMHLGTALAVTLYFRERILSLLKELPGLLRFKLENPNENLIFLRNFVFTTGCSVVAILLLKPLADQARSPWVIVFTQSIFGVLLWVADVRQRTLEKKEKRLNFFATAPRYIDSAFIGIAQALAIFPGVSRSGITLTAAFVRGIDRKDAGAFSFLLSLPIIFAGVLVEIPEIISSVQSGTHNLAHLVLGVAVSFFVGLATIHFFMKLIARIHLGWFTSYRLILALVLVFLLMR